MEASVPEIPYGKEVDDGVKLSGEMNPSGTTVAQLKPPADGGKTKMIEEAQESLSLQCGLCDKQVTHKIAQELLSGLATTCIDSTTGGIFRTPSTVAVEIRNEMVDYLRTRSEQFVAESIVMEGGSEAEVSAHPFDVISNFIDEFALQKRNFFSRVSGWILSDMREDKIDDFVQQMEMNSFWVLDRRETVTQVLLRNVDYKNQYHCKMRFASKEELQEHQRRCEFRPVMCDNEGCSDTFSAKQVEKHDSNCSFKLLHCEQGCPVYLLRREMDRHCITVCPMKLTSCTFYSVGCQYQAPQCNIKQHCSDNHISHLVHVLQFIHKDSSREDAQLWAEKIENSEFSDQLEARDVRSFTRAVKDIESRIGPFKVQKEEIVKDVEAPRLSEDACTKEPSPGQAMKDPSEEETSKDSQEASIGSLILESSSKSTTYSLEAEQRATNPPLDQITTVPEPEKGER